MASQIDTERALPPPPLSLSALIFHTKLTTPPSSSYTGPSRVSPKGISSKPIPHPILSQHLHHHGHDDGARSLSPQSSVTELILTAQHFKRVRMKTLFSPC